jgi:protoporphyrinogen/coproporphyrinogen III oxidase
MVMKRIVIIGGGISGLTVLHYLKQRLGNTVEITLFEREAQVGGCICTLKKKDSVFECGPNCFLDYQPATLQLIEELNLTKQLIEANPSARRRYIQIKGKLIAVPMDPVNFIRTPLISSKDKWALIKGLFKRNISADCSIYDYVNQRFSKGIAEFLVDPVISGIYAGDIKRLHMASAFPKLARRGFKKTRMRSFLGGMGQIIETLSSRYQSHIQTNTEISLAKIKTDITVVATPAYAAARIIEDINPRLSQVLGQIPYVPIAAVGLSFAQNAFRIKPDGFGFLIPSNEHKDILGVLIESNIFAPRAGHDQIMLRVLLGGAHNPDIINYTQQEILAKAIKEIDTIYGLKVQPLETFVKIWPKAIPQYEMNYPVLRQSISEQCAKTPGLYLCSNYLDGISFNDCINNAKSIAETVAV